MVGTGYGRPRKDGAGKGMWHLDILTLPLVLARQSKFIESWRCEGTRLDI